MAPRGTAPIELQSYVIDSMIQGVTQQSEWDRRDSQAEAQFDCVNSPVNGCEARPGFDFIALLGNTDHTLAFKYEIFRGDTEHYLVVVDTDPSPIDGHRLRVYNADTGAPCSVSYEVSEDYFKTTANPPSVSLMATTLNDTTFVGNREVITRMSKTNVSAPRDNAAIMFFRAGGYLVTFQVAVTIPAFAGDVDGIGGKVYTWNYVTPDNSTEANAQYIATNELAATFFRSFTGVDAVVTASGTVVDTSNLTNVCTISIATPAVIGLTAHGLVAGQPVAFGTTGALPTGLATDTTYYVIASGLTADAFEVAATPGGSAIDTSGTQSGVQTVSAGLPPGAVTGVGGADSGAHAGASGGGASATGSITLTSLGFQVKLNGNCILIRRDDSLQWQIDTGDGVGDTYLHCAKEVVQNFSDLPASCFSGFQTKVIGSNQNVDDDYYVQFIGADGSAGFWKEVVAPSTSLSFDPSTMPITLVNTNVNTFRLTAAPWGNRVSGDGIVSALDPSFIGQQLQEMGFDHGRLTLMAEGSTVWSRAKGPFVFFPDSAQTVLDTDPIDIQPGGGKVIALLRRIVQIAESTFLWAEKIQFRAHSGSLPFTEANIQVPPSTNYEFSPLAIPKAVGQSLYFVTETGKWATIRDLATQQGLPVGATDVTGHVKKYIPSGIRWLAASDTLGVLFASTTGAQSLIFVYNYLLSATARLQSAWNTWRLPPDSNVLWCGMDLNYLFALVQRQEGACLIRADLTVDVADTDEGATYLTRLDLRVNESQCTVTYNSGSNRSTITLPYTIADAMTWDGTTKCPMMVVNRDGVGTRKRGHSWVIDSFPTLTTILVEGDLTADHWYVGFRIRAERTMSALYLKTTKGIQPADWINIADFIVNFDNSGYFRAEVSYKERPTEPPSVTEMSGQFAGDNQSTVGNISLAKGAFKIEVAQDSTKVAITLVNDSFLPSQWISCFYTITTSSNFRPSQYGQSIPSYFAQGGSAGYANNF